MKNDTIQVFSLDRSQYSELVYAQCGVYVTACLGDEPPLWYRAHLKERPKVQKGSRLEKLLKSPSTFSDIESYNILNDELIPSLEAFFEQLDTIEKIMLIVRQGNPNTIADVSRTIMEWFNVPIPEPGPKKPIGVIHK